MNRRFLTAALIYQVLLIVVVLLTDLGFNGQSNLELIRAGIYVLVVICSWLLGLSALVSAVSRRRRGILRYLTWPPEWDLIVAGWALTKAVFFSGLGWIVAGEGLSGLTTTVILVIFAETHLVFTARWLGMGGAKEGASS